MRLSQEELSSRIHSVRSFNTTRLFPSRQPLSRAPGCIAGSGQGGSGRSSILFLTRGATMGGAGCPFVSLSLLLIEELVEELGKLI